MDQKEQRPGRPKETILIHPAILTQNTQFKSMEENEKSIESFEDNSQVIENENLADSVSEQNGSIEI